VVEAGGVTKKSLANRHSKIDRAIRASQMALVANLLV
jgi:hypothetical protein